MSPALLSCRLILPMGASLPPGSCSVAAREPLTNSSGPSRGSAMRRTESGSEDSFCNNNHNLKLLFPFFERCSPASPQWHLWLRLARCTCQTSPSGGTCPVPFLVPSSRLCQSHEGTSSCRPPRPSWPCFWLVPKPGVMGGL